MLTEIQKVILTCLRGPEDIGAWKRERNREAGMRCRAKSLEAYRLRDRESKKAYRLLHPGVPRPENQRKRVRRQTDPVYKLGHNLRVRLKDALSGKTKSAQTRELIGCSLEHLKLHLEKQFLPGMTWVNYGPVWHVDHIKPCAIFDLTDPEQQKSCFHWTNLQPLFAVENLKKGDKYVG